VGQGTVAALGAALCFGAATALQARGAREAEGRLVGAVRQAPYLAGLGLDAAGFVLEVVALRTLPVYTVGAALAASLAVTAVLAGPLLGARPGRGQWAAVATVCGGLALLALASGREGPGHGGSGLRWGTLAAALAVLALGAVPPARVPRRFRAALLGLAAGFGFGVVEVAVRLLDPVTPGALAANPASYALLVGGGAAFLLLTSALHQGSVTAATAGMVLGETVGPALVGVLALQDRTRAGWAPAAVAGFALAVAGGLALARYGEGGTAPKDSGEARWEAAG
jgi:drug/metabolite transporter (DMT)-like permease